MQYWDDGHMDDGWGIAMVLGMLGVWIAVIAVIAFAVAWTLHSTRTPAVGSPALPATPVAGSGSVTSGAEQILAERLARGEIDSAEYRERLAELTSRS